MTHPLWLIYITHELYSAGNDDVNSAECNLNNDKVRRLPALYIKNDGTGLGNFCSGNGDKAEEFDFEIKKDEYIKLGCPVLFSWQALDYSKGISKNSLVWNNTKKKIRY